MFPWMPTAWFGMVTKLPGRTPPSAGMNRPPEAASKTVTPRISPMPNVMSRGRRLSLKAPLKRGRFGLDLDDFRGDLDDRVVEADRVALARQDIRGGGTVHRHPP